MSVTTAVFQTLFFRMRNESGYFRDRQCGFNKRCHFCKDFLIVCYACDNRSANFCSFVLWCVCDQMFNEFFLTRINQHHLSLHSMNNVPETTNLMLIFVTSIHFLYISNSSCLSFTSLFSFFCVNTSERKYDHQVIGFIRPTSAPTKNGLRVGISTTICT